MTPDEKLAQARADLAQAKAELDWNTRKITADMARSLLYRYPHPVTVSRRDLGLLPEEPAPTTPDGVYVITTLE